MKPEAGAGATAAARWEHFPHQADVGIRGCGPDLEAAFEQAALAMMAVVVDPGRVESVEWLMLECEAPDSELLLYDWLNSLVYEMATRHILFSQFKVQIEGQRLRAEVGGERVDIDRHKPRVEIKGATFTELRVAQDAQGLCCAQCVLDV